MTACGLLACVAVWRNRPALANRPDPTLFSIVALATVIGILLIATLACPGAPRYRLPYDPALLTAASLGLALLFNRRSAPVG